MKNQEFFSRDILTCIKWAREIDWKSGERLGDLWSNVDFITDYKSENLNSIKSDFIKNSFKFI